jgi:hypothetical protein
MNDKLIEQFNKHQNSGKFHPYTCDRQSKDCEVKINPRDYTKDGVLIATADGLVCPCGKYTQKFEESMIPIINEGNYLTFQNLINKK